MAENTGTTPSTPEVEVAFRLLREEIKRLSVAIGAATTAVDLEVARDAMHSLIIDIEDLVVEASEAMG